ncbi:MAG: glycosyltransferase family 2 protein [Ginsengibacter sp.]
MPKVSVCIPAYNQVKYLKRTIDSILNQTFSDYEIIITDDSSTDIVFNLVQEYQMPEKIKYHKNLPTLGSPENWNESIRKASGEYIKIVHHDDWLNSNESLAKYVKLLDDNLDADLGFSATRVVKQDGTEYTHQLSDGQLEIVKLNPLVLFRDNFIGAPSAVIFRKNTNILFDPKIKWLVDKEYYIRQLENNKNIVYDPELLIVTFLAEGRVTDECCNNKEIEIFEFFYVLQKIYKKKIKYSKDALSQSIVTVMNICNKYRITNTNEIRQCGYKGKIPYPIKKSLSNYFYLIKKAERVIQICNQNLRRMIGLLTIHIFK